MTQKLNIDNGLQGWKTEHQAVTGSIFYCRGSWSFSVSATNKLSCNLKKLMLRNSQQKHTAKPLSTEFFANSAVIKI